VAFPPGALIIRKGIKKEKKKNLRILSQGASKVHSGRDLGRRDKPIRVISGVEKREEKGGRNEGG